MAGHSATKQWDQRQINALAESFTTLDQDEHWPEVLKAMIAKARLGDVHAAHFLAKLYGKLDAARPVAKEKPEKAAPPSKTLADYSYDELVAELQRRQENLGHVPGAAITVDSEATRNKKVAR